MTLEQLQELQKLSWEWAEYAGLDKKSEIETLLDLNKEIQEAWESRENEEEFIKELADIFLICIRDKDIKPLKYNEKEFRKSYKPSLRRLFMDLLQSKSYLQDVATDIMMYCVKCNINLYNHVKLKLKFNYTRPEYKK